MVTCQNAVDDQNRPGTDLNEVFDVLAHRHRRAVIDELAMGGPRSVGELAERLADRDVAASASDAELSLVHRHLPKLDDGGVIRYDTADRRCRLDGARTERAVLAAARDEF